MQVGLKFSGIYQARYQSVNSQTSPPQELAEVFNEIEGSAPGEASARAKRFLQSFGQEACTPYIRKFFKGMADRVHFWSNDDGPRSSKGVTDYYVSDDEAGQDFSNALKELNGTRDKMLEKTGLKPSDYEPYTDLEWQTPLGFYRGQLARVLPSVELMISNSIMDSLDEEPTVFESEDSESDISINEQIQSDLMDQVLQKHFAQAVQSGTTQAVNAYDYFLLLDSDAQARLRSSMESEAKAFFELLYQEHQKLGENIIKEAKANERIGLMTVLFDADESFSNFLRPKLKVEPVIIIDR